MTDNAHVPIGNVGQATELSNSGDEQQSQGATNQAHSLQQAQYSGAISLIIHEDKHNWTKLHHFMYVSLAMIGTYGYLVDKWYSAQRVVATAIDYSKGDTFLLVATVVCVVGILVSVGFFYTLLDGVCCLIGHKQVITYVERDIICESSMRLFSTHPSPTRVVLYWSPVVVFHVWVLFLSGPVLVRTGFINWINSSFGLFGYSLLIVLEAVLVVTTIKWANGKVSLASKKVSSATSSRRAVGKTVVHAPTHPGHLLRSKPVSDSEGS